MAFNPPYPPWDPSDRSSFSYETVLRRWPIIVTSVVDHIHNSCNDLALDPGDADVTTAEAKLQEGRQIIAKISGLKYHMGRDHALELIPDDGEPLVDLYNEQLRNLQENGKGTWFTAPWLFAECYLYRLLRSYFVLTTHWKDHDPFFAQKMKTFKQSGNSILQIAITMHEMEIGRETDPEKLGVLFQEMIQMCLWGNATDLSLLTHLSASDMERLQSVGKDVQAARRQFILRDDQDKVWDHISHLKNAGVDFVLDNSGFELFTDLVLADFLVTFTPFIGRVKFHPKLIPWFVSDVTPPDFEAMLASLKNAPEFFAINSPSSAESYDYLSTLVSRWQKYLDQGVFSLSVPFETPLGGGGIPQAESALYWTSSQPYWNMEYDAPNLFKDLSESQLVIFKGDLNYRKLTGDVKWPAWTDFEQALGPLAGSFPLLSLRTNKADVVVGVERDVAERLDQSGEKWRVNGRYALISFLGRTN